MLNRLKKIIGMSTDSASPNEEYDPIYGLPKRAVEEWLARNPRLREEYEVELRQRQQKAPSGSW